MRILLQLSQYLARSGIVHFQITEGVVTAAAGNRWSRKEVVKLLLARKGTSDDGKSKLQDSERIAKVLPEFTLLDLSLEDVQAKLKKKELVQCLSICKRRRSNVIVKRQKVGMELSFRHGRNPELNEIDTDPVGGSGQTKQ